MTLHPDADTALLAKINAAVKTANVAEQSVTTAQAELVSRSKEVGLLLLEAKAASGGERLRGIPEACRRSKTFSRL